MTRIEKVLSEHELVSYVDEFLRLKKVGERFKAVCIFHEEKTASLVVTPRTQRWKCFGCQRGGNIIHFVREQFNCDTRAALDILEKKPIDTRRHISIAKATAPSKQFMKAISELKIVGAGIELDTAILLGLLEHPLTRSKAMRTICDTGNLWLHAKAVTIPKNPKLFRWSEEVRLIKEQCRARDVIELADMNGEL
jgi:hypothetical protein